MVIFQTAVSLTILLVRSIIPDIPKNVSQKIRREKFIVDDILIRAEKLKTAEIRSKEISRSKLNFKDDSDQIEKIAS